MKKRLVLTAMLGMVLALGLPFVGCNTGNDDDGANRGGVYLTGTYGRYMVSSGTYNGRLIFTGTTFFFNKSSGTVLSGTYKYDGAILTLTISGVKHNKYANLNGTTIIISGDGAYSEYLNDRWTIR
jgi:hypothetical protein